MKEIMVLIDSIDKVKEFAKKANKVDSDLLLKSGLYTVDGKSIMGIFSLDITKPLKLSIIDDNADISAIESFVFDKEIKS